MDASGQERVRGATGEASGAAGAGNAGEPDPPRCVKQEDDS